MESCITRAEHEEFRRRMEDEHDRMNHRLAELDDNVKRIGELTLSVEKLAISVENMVKSQSRHEERLETLENRDGEKWRTISGYVLTLLVGAILSFVLIKIGLK